MHRALRADLYKLTQELEQAVQSMVQGWLSEPTRRGGTGATAPIAVAAFRFR